MAFFQATRRSGRGMASIFRFSSSGSLPRTEGPMKAFQPIMLAEGA